MNHKFIVLLLLFLVCLPISSFSRDFREMMKHADSLSNSLYQDSALIIGKLALDMAIDEVGPDDTAVARISQRVGDFHFFKQEYLKVEPYYQRSLTIHKKVLGSDHRYVARNLGNLAVLYRRLGRFAEAEPLYFKAIEILIKSLGPENHLIAFTHSNIAALYTSQGRNADAEINYIKALEIFVKLYGEEDHSVAINLNSLGVIYREQGKFDQAESLFVKARTIFEKIHGYENTWVAHSLNDLSILYIMQKKYQQAEKICLDAYEIGKISLGPYHPHVTKYIHNLANIYTEMGQYTKADSFYHKAIELKTKAVGYDHYTIALIENDYSRLLRLLDNNDKAFSLAEHSARVMKNSFTANVHVLSETEALKFSNYIREAFSIFMSCYFDGLNNLDEIPISVADLIISNKGKVSDGLFDRQKSLVLETDSTILNLVEELRFTRFRLSQKYVKGAGEDIQRYQDEMDLLNNRVHELESSLSVKSASFRKQSMSTPVTIENLNAQLSESKCLIEFLKYDYIQLTSDSLIPRYLAVVFNRDTLPAVVELGVAQEIDSLVDIYRRHLIRLSNSGRTTKRDLEEYQTISNKIYQKIWKPLEIHFVDPHLVLIAPDGGLNMLSFAGLHNNQGEYLVEKYSLHYLSSGRDLIRLEEKTEKTEGLFAMGDPEYDASPELRFSSSSRHTAQFAEESSSLNRGLASECNRLSGIKVSPLPGTRNEISQITEGWQRQFDENITTFLGAEASEENFKRFAPGNRVIHLATHGYFVESYPSPNWDSVNSSSVDIISDNPLLLSGLFLAGANLHESMDNRDMSDDGILTAYEVTSLNLSGSELVVLSACESGLGEVKAGEGVYGLRRAFQLAGARTVLSSMWPVSDRATVDFMASLYQESSLPLYEKIRNYQLDYLEKLRSNDYPDHPLKWSPFIATGDWR